MYWYLIIPAQRIASTNLNSTLTMLQGIHIPFPRMVLEPGTSCLDVEPLSSSLA